MERRTAMRAMGSAVGLAAVPLLLTAKSTPAAAAPTPIPVGTWRADTLQYGFLSLKLSREILKRSTNAIVLEFAHLEIIEQTTAAEVLTHSLNPPPPALTAQQRTDYQSLVASPTPDYTYAFLQMHGHQSLYHIQNDFLAGDADLTMDPVHEALLLRSNVLQHLRLLEKNVMPAVTST